MSVGRLFLGPGRFREPLRSEIVAAGPLVLEEGLRGSYVLREAGEYTLNPTRGAVAVCPNRFVVWARRAKTVDVPLTRAWFERLTVTADRPDRLVITAQLGATPGVSIDSLAVRLRTPQAQRIVTLLDHVR